jgi:hypothetical protein
VGASPAPNVVAKTRLLLGLGQALPILLAGLEDPVAGSRPHLGALGRLARRLAGLLRRGARGCPACHPLRDRGFVALVRREVVAALAELLGQVALVHVGALEIVRVAIADADAVVLHPGIRGVSQVERNGECAEGVDVPGRGEVGLPGPVRLRRGGDVRRRLG